MKSYPPLVSTVIETFNGDQSVTESIASVDAQSFPAMEIVVLDEGVSDNTVEVAKRQHLRPVPVTRPLLSTPARASICISQRDPEVSNLGREGNLIPCSGLLRVAQNHLVELTF